MKHMVTSFPKPFLRMLGIDAFFGILPGNAVPVHEPTDPVFPGGGDSHSYLTKLIQSAFNLSHEQIKDILRNTAKATFADDETKAKLLAHIDNM